MPRTENVYILFSAQVKGQEPSLMIHYSEFDDIDDDGDDVNDDGDGSSHEIEQEER